MDQYQETAVNSPVDVPLIIYAGPGSGKTSTLLNRILRQVNVEIQNIHPCSFTPALTPHLLTLNNHLPYCNLLSLTSNL